MCARHRSLTIGVCLVGLAGVVLSAYESLGRAAPRRRTVLRTEPGVVTRSILTVGDSVAGYRLAGIPDGLGAFDNQDGTFTLLVNHEIRDTLGVPRAHGAKGAFVSKWIIRKTDLTVVHGSDLIQQVVTWNPTTAFSE